MSLIAVALSFHLLMLKYDITSNFRPFLWGDRGGDRWDAIRDLVQSEPAAYLSTMVQAGVVPGEYIFQLPGYLIGGPAGIITFQIILSLLAAICVYKTAAIMLPWRRAPFICGLVYILLPQNVVFSHQFVTEAIATPLCAFFFYLQADSLRRNRFDLALWAGLCYGLAIFVRPSLAFALPPLLLLPMLYASGCRRAATVRAAAICAVASLPMLCWVTTFTLTAGKFGYTSGIASLSWNLRSKVFLVYSRNGLAQPPEVARFSSYPELYTDAGGITVSRYLQIVSEHPGFFARDAVISAVEVLGRGNASKFLVDYLGVARSTNIKDLPATVLGGDGNAAALFDAAAGNMEVVVLLAVEVIASILTLFFAAITTGFILFSLVRPREVAARIGRVTFQSMLAIASVLFAVLMSGEIVDSAQARLRSPVEGGLIVVCGLLIYYRSVARNSRKSASRYQP